MNRTQQNQLNQDQLNAFREQQIVNTRILSLKQAMKLASMRSAKGETPTTDEVISDANKLAAFYIEDLDGLKKKSGLVITANMPPPGAGFKPGD